MRLVLAFFAGIILVSLPSRSLACKCAPPPSPTDALRDAAAVFEGKVTKLTEVDLELEVDLNVVQAWKGIETETIRIRTRKDSAACGIDFKVDESYLVYASQGEPQASGLSLLALRCSRTKLSAEAATEDYPQLGVGVVPVAARDPKTSAPTTPAADTVASPGAGAQPPPAEPPAAGGCASCSAGTTRPAPLYAGLLLAGLVLARVVRRPRR